MSTTTSPSKMLCQYVGRLCNQPRVVKANGELHRLCQFHRVRANASQQRLRIRKSHIHRQEELQSEYQQIFNDDDVLAMSEEELAYLLSILEAEEAAEESSNESTETQP